MSRLAGRWRGLSRAGRTLVALVVTAAVAIAAVGAVAASSGGDGTRHVTARFSRVIGLYVGNDVRILGVKVGKIDKITPDGTYVTVRMSYDGKYRLPADVQAVLVPPSVVSDRYVQLSPVYTGGPALADGAHLDLSRTVVPLEFDEIFRNLDQLNRALGPEGANSKGALSRLIDVSARNLGGNGDVLNGALKEFSAAISTLAGSRTDLFSTVRQLQQFTTTIASDDGGVRALNANLAQVGAQLSSERKDLGAALANLSTALQLVNTFVADNRTRLTTDIHKLTSVSQVLQREKEALTEIVDMAPFGLANLSLASDPKAHTLDTKDDASEPLSDPTATDGVLCQLLPQACTGTSSSANAKSLADLLAVSR